MMKAVFRVLAIAIVAAVFPGCSGFWGKDALSYLVWGSESLSPGKSVWEKI
jgi:hypothetical protein